MTYNGLKYQVKEDYKRKHKKLKRQQERRADRVIAYAAIAYKAEITTENRLDPGFRADVEKRVRSAFGPIGSLLFSFLIRKLVELLLDRIATSFRSDTYTTVESQFNAIDRWASGAEADLAGMDR